ncbi:hypothetical protein [Hymenobacter yonginensis]|uniref:TonB C-terminal domain-containing protein n=1 Tax=Hymenobacter yonginensis TaxID=748197 RepID=A0ABY7PT52_9BACT|nr:hypothetical protein [Hymenobacter yonginensis]WBO86085.1 hypothetical protein O9Z63_07470 [Hymenobacter yonginensis]
MSSLLLFVLCLVGSCAVVGGVILIEFMSFSRGQDDFQEGSYLLIFFSLFLSFCGLVAGCFSRKFGHVLAILLGLAPVKVLSFFIYEVSGHSTRAVSPADQLAAEEQEQARIKARRAALTRAALAQRQAIARTHPYAGRDSTQPYYTADQMPSLTGKPEFRPEQHESYHELAHLLSRAATPHLDHTELQPDTIPVSFIVGPYGGIFQVQIQYGEIPETGAHTRAEAAVLQAVEELPLLHPGRMNGQPVSVRILVLVSVPASH